MYIPVCSFLPFLLPGTVCTGILYDDHGLLNKWNLNEHSQADNTRQNGYGI